MATGKVVQVIGPVVDVEFPPDQLPDIYNAVSINRGSDDVVAAESNGHGGERKGIAALAGPASSELIAEVAQHLGDNVVRCVAMDSTDGLMRGMVAEDTGSPIMVPVGD